MPTQTLTTQTTASTEVARAGPPTYTAWQVIDGVAIATAGILAAIASLIGIVNGLRGWMRDRRAPDEQSIADIRTKMAGLEKLCGDFKTKAELAEDAKALKDDLEHEKVARKADGKAAVDKFREHDAAIVSLREGMARQDALIAGFNAAVGRIENAIDRQTERFDTRFDGLQRLVMEKV